MDPGRMGFDCGGVPRGGGPQMLLFGGGGSANSNGFVRGVPMAVLGRDDDAHIGKRPFFTTHEELLEEDYYDEEAPERKRRLAPEQVEMLVGASRRRTSWSRSERRSWRSAWGWRLGKWLCGSRTAAHGGRLCSWRPILAVSRPPTTLLPPTTMAF